MEYEKLKKNKKKNNFPTDRPLLEKQGRERGNKNIFKDGLKKYLVYDIEISCAQIQLVKLSVCKSSGWGNSDKNPNKLLRF